MTVVACTEPSVVRPPPTRRRAERPTAKQIAKANALRTVAAPWCLARKWPGLPVADRRGLHHRVGKLTPTAHDILGAVRKAVRCGFPGLHVSAADLAEHFCVSDRQVFRALAELDDAGLVRRVHGYVAVGCELDRRASRDAAGRRTGKRETQRYRNRQVPSVLVLASSAIHPSRRKEGRAAASPVLRAKAIRGDVDVIPTPVPEKEPTALSPGTCARAKTAPAAREGVGCADRQDPGVPADLAVGSVSPGLGASSSSSGLAPPGEADRPKVDFWRSLCPETCEGLGVDERPEEQRSDDEGGAGCPPPAAPQEPTHETRVLPELERGPDPATAVDWSALAFLEGGGDGADRPAAARGPVDWSAAADRVVEAAVLAFREAELDPPPPRDPAPRDEALPREPRESRGNVIELFPRQDGDLDPPPRDGAWCPACDGRACECPTTDGAA